MSPDDPIQQVCERLAALESEVRALRGAVKPRQAGKAFLSLREAARRLGVSRNSTLADLISDRRIKTVRLNGRLKVPAAEVERLIRETGR